MAKSADRDARLAAALRENLKRRKVHSRATALTEPPAEADGTISELPGEPRRNPAPKGL